ncbi:hypothetical protein Ahia01_000110900 [Argonauta hians]
MRRACRHPAGLKTRPVKGQRSSSMSLRPSNPMMWVDIQGASASANDGLLGRPVNASVDNLRKTGRLACTRAYLKIVPRSNLHSFEQLTQEGLSSCRIFA